MVPAMGPENAPPVTVPEKFGEVATFKVTLPEVPPPVKFVPAATPVISPSPIPLAFI